jgi:pimeloyl-ACP methyl ester carboxylesterase
MPAEPVSRYYFSQRLKLHYVVWGDEANPPVLLVHGNRDHARTWDRVAERLRDRWCVYAVIAHSLGGAAALEYAGVFPERVRKLVAIEGLGPRIGEQTPGSQRMRAWVNSMRDFDRRRPRRYVTIDDAVRRMLEENPHLTEEMARHLTIHGSRRNEDGTFSWKFDNYVRLRSPYEFNIAEAREIWNQIRCPVLLVRGSESWASDPEADGKASAFHNYTAVVVKDAGHWVHHDQLDVFMQLVDPFIA